MRKATTPVSRPARWIVLFVAVLFLPMLVACGGGGTDLVAQPQELAVLDDCSSATVYTDRLVAGLWNQLCPADPVDAPYVEFDSLTGEFWIRDAIRGRNLVIHGFLATKLSILNGLQLGDVATVVFTITAGDTVGGGTIFISPDEKHSLSVTGELHIENKRCEVLIEGLEMRGWAAGTTARLWGCVPFRTREVRTGDLLEGEVNFEEVELTQEAPPARMDVWRTHGDGPYPERTQYEVVLDPRLFEIFG
jgi:hypothetical protein